MKRRAQWKTSPLERLRAPASAAPPPRRLLEHRSLPIPIPGADLRGVTIEPMDGRWGVEPLRILISPAQAADAALVRALGSLDSIYVMPKLDGPIYKAAEWLAALAAEAAEEPPPTYYVDPTAEGPGSGTFKDPFKSLSDIPGGLQPGSTVLARRGVPWPK